MPIRSRKQLEENMKDMMNAPLAFAAQTSSTNVVNVARLAAGFRYWQYAGPLDKKTSAICRALHGKVFDQQNPAHRRWVPPVHINCRHYMRFISDPSGLRVFDETEITPQLYKQAHFVHSPHKYVALHVPAAPSGRDFVFRRVRDPETGERISVLDWRRKGDSFEIVGLERLLPPPGEPPDVSIDNVRRFLGTLPERMRTNRFLSRIELTNERLPNNAFAAYFVDDTKRGLVRISLSRIRAVMQQQERVSQKYRRWLEATQQTTVERKVLGSIAEGVSWAFVRYLRRHHPRLIAEAVVLATKREVAGIRNDFEAQLAKSLAAVLLGQQRAIPADWRRLVQDILKVIEQ